METKAKFFGFAILLSEHIDILSKDAHRVVFNVDESIQALEWKAEGLDHVVYMCKLLRGSARNWAIASVWRSLLGIAYFRDRVRLRIESVEGTDWLVIRRPFSYNHQMNPGRADLDKLNWQFSLWSGMRIRILKRALCMEPCQRLSKKPALAA